MGEHEAEKPGAFRQTIEPHLLRCVPGVTDEVVAAFDDAMTGIAQAMWLIQRHHPAKNSIATSIMMGEETYSLRWQRLSGELPEAQIARLRARVAELEADRDKAAKATTAAIAIQKTLAYDRGAEAMRERAGTLCEVAGELLGMAGDDDARTVLRNLAAKVRALPLTDDAREDGGSDGE